MVSTLIRSFMLFILRIAILRPFILCVCLAMAVLAAMLVAVFLSPSFTPETLLAGIARVKLLMSVLYVPLCIASFLFELVVLLRRITCFWPHEAGMGRGR